MKIVMTVVYLISGGKMLLGLKKVRLGAGYLNGFGGHVEQDETIEQSALREFEAECGLKLLDLKKNGIALITEQDSADDVELHIFSATKFEGTLCESDEMTPKWYSLAELPYESMWPSDRILLPLLLEGKLFLAGVSYRRKRKITVVTFGEVKRLPKGSDLEN